MKVIVGAGGTGGHLYPALALVPTKRNSLSGSTSFIYSTKAKAGY